MFVLCTTLHLCVSRIINCSVHEVLTFFNQKSRFLCYTGGSSIIACMHGLHMALHYALELLKLALRMCHGGNLSDLHNYIHVQKNMFVLLHCICVFPASLF